MAGIKRSNCFWLRYSSLVLGSCFGSEARRITFILLFFFPLVIISSHFPCYHIEGIIHILSKHISVLYRKILHSVCVHVCMHAWGCMRVHIHTRFWRKIEAVVNITLGIHLYFCLNFWNLVKFIISDSAFFLFLLLFVKWCDAISIEGM